MLRAIRQKKKEKKKSREQARGVVVRRRNERDPLMMVLLFSTHQGNRRTRTLALSTPPNPPFAQSLSADPVLLFFLPLGFWPNPRRTKTRGKRLFRSPATLCCGLNGAYLARKGIEHVDVASDRTPVVCRRLFFL